MTGGGNTVSVSQGSGKATPKTAKTRTKVKFITSPKWKGRCAASLRRAKAGSSSSRIQVPLQSLSRNTCPLPAALQTTTGLRKEKSCPRTFQGAEEKENAGVCRAPKKTFHNKGVQVELITDTGSWQDVDAACTEPTQESEMVLSASVVPSAQQEEQEEEEVSMEQYWMEMAEQRRKALVETLMENEELCADIALLKCKVRELETLANCLNYQSILSTATSDDSCLELKPKDGDQLVKEEST